MDDDECPCESCQSEKVRIREEDKEGAFCGIRRELDYAKILFELSRANRIEMEGETSVTVIIERAWAGDVSKYIAELENKIFELYDFIKLEKRVDSVTGLSYPISRADDKSNPGRTYRTRPL